MKKTSTKRPMSVVQIIRFIVAGYILVIVLSQLFSFDKFPAMLAGLPGVMAVVCAIILVVTEVGALPFLLAIDISGRLRKVSAVMGVVALLLLTLLEGMAFCHGVSMIFGATFDLPGGSWSLLFLAGVWILAIWASGFGQGGATTTVKSRERSTARKDHAKPKRKKKD